MTIMKNNNQKLNNNTPLGCQLLQSIEQLFQQNAINKAVFKSVLFHFRVSAYIIGKNRFFASSS